MITITCPKCNQEFFIDSGEVTAQCPHCDKEFDLCQFCHASAPDVDDYGVVACNQCLKDNPDVQKHLNNMVRNDMIKEGEDHEF